MKRNYNFHNSCYRFTHGNPPSKDEVHPCFFCGEQLPLTTKECPKCGIMICSRCGNCLCSISTAEYKALIKIHQNYCCHLDEYSGVISHINTTNAKVRNLVHNCERTISHCYRLQFPTKKAHFISMEMKPYEIIRRLRRLFCLGK